MNIDTTAPVLVTGATGYVAGPLVRRLLEEGLTVHATVRDPSKTDRLQYLLDLAARLPGTLRFFGADLLTPGSFAEAMAGCQVVFHVASPYVLDVKDPQAELVDPAVNGTRNVLEAVNATPTVTRVVLTSSCAAVYGDAIDLQATPRGVFDEHVWNTTSSLTHNPYSYSKTLAEWAAWEMAGAQDRWRLVVCNPAAVMGPGERLHEGSESFQQLKMLAGGDMAQGVPDLRIGVVDVRDLAEAHLRAAFLPDAEGRHVLVGTNASFPQMADVIRARWPHLPLPKRVAPKWLLWLVGPFMGLQRAWVTCNVGHPWIADTTKSREALGLTYRSLDETMNDFVAQAVEA
ncbi:MAG: NAD-dependent epimerase/dehydratase family protein, partial [Myxococcales bacterium]|nr:NAD-dependent epimerase/dehydratase family protein [Myxococcales bacterium]